MPASAPRAPEQGPSPLEEIVKCLETCNHEESVPPCFDIHVKSRIQALGLSQRTATAVNLVVTDPELGKFRYVAYHTAKLPRDAAESFPPCPTSLSGPTKVSGIGSEGGK